MGRVLNLSPCPSSLNDARVSVEALVFPYASPRVEKVEGLPQSGKTFAEWGI